MPVYDYRMLGKWVKWLEELVSVATPDNMESLRASAKRWRALVNEEISFYTALRGRLNTIIWRTHRHALTK